MPVHPFYRLYWQDGAQFDYSNDDAQLEAQIRAFSPADVDGYRRFLAYAKNVYREGYERLGHVAFLNFRAMIAAAPLLVRCEAYTSGYHIVPRYGRAYRPGAGVAFYNRQG